MISDIIFLFNNFVDRMLVTGLTWTWVHSLVVAVYLATGFLNSKNREYTGMDLVIFLLYNSPIGSI